MLGPSPVSTPRFVGRGRETAALRGALTRQSSSGASTQAVKPFPVAL
jgi:hypothetical protein